MRRNLDLTALRSFVAVADTGGVTRAATLLNLTQSAVSMQVKRLEEALGMPLFDRNGRGISVTTDGELLANYARRMVALNDEAVGRLTAQEYGGEITLGVPHDIVYPFIPQILQRFNAAYPRMRVNLLSSYTTALRETFAKGECGIVLTTETEIGPGGEELTRIPLIWAGAVGGSAWRQRPLRLGFCRHCAFRPGVQRALDDGEIPWNMAVDSDSDRTVETTVSADLAVSAFLEGAQPPLTEPINHGGALPTLGDYGINLYVADTMTGPAERAFVEVLREVYAAPAIKRSPQQPSLSIVGAE